MIICSNGCIEASTRPRRRVQSVFDSWFGLQTDPSGGVSVLDDVCVAQE